MAKKSQKRSKQNKAKKMDDLPAGPKAKSVKGGINRWVKLGTVVDLIENEATR